MFLVQSLLLVHCMCRRLFLNLITHNDIQNDTHTRARAHFIGFPCTSDRPVAEASTYIPFTTNINTPAGFKPTVPATELPQSLESAVTGTGDTNT